MAPPLWLNYDSAAQEFNYEIFSDNSLAGIYSITVTASGISFQFDIEVQSSCGVAVLTIDDTIFLPTTSYTMTQVIWQTALETKTWTDPIVTVKDKNGTIITTCGTYVYDFLDSGSTSLVASSEFNFDLATKNFSMQTNLPAKVGDWFLKLKVSLLNWPTAPAGIKDFKVQYINVCEPPTSITPSSVSTQTYNLTYATALSFVVGAFAVNQTICPINYSFGISP